MIRQRLEIEGESQGLKSAADRLKLDPQYLALLEVIRESPGALIFDGRSMPKTIAELDRELTRQLPETGESQAKLTEGTDS